MTKNFENGRKLVLFAKVSKKLIGQIDMMIPRKNWCCRGLGDFDELGPITSQ